MVTYIMNLCDLARYRTIIDIDGGSNAHGSWQRFITACNLFHITFKLVIRHNLQ